MAVLYDLGVSVVPNKTETVHAGWVIRGDFDEGLFAKVRERCRESARGSAPSWG